MIDQEIAYKAIYDATVDVLTRYLFGATQTPCNDFYDTVKEAAEKAFSGATIQVVEKEQ